MVEFNKKIQEQFDKMSKSGKLFRTELTGSETWDIYLNSFTDENDPIFRDPESSTHNCNHCKNFMRRYGNIVSINENNEIVSMFDIEIDGEYKDTAKMLSEKIKSSKIHEVFFETFDELNSLPYESCKKSNDKFLLGVVKNVKRYTKEEAELYGVVKENEIRTFNHVHVSVATAFIDKTGKSLESITAIHRDAKNVFQRAMEEIPLATLELVRDLGAQGSLLDIDAHLYKINTFIPLKEAYDKLSEKQKDNWCWVTSRDLPIAKFKNELIGVLCTELAEGVELNKAVQSWNKRVDPINYMKAIAPFTEKQKQDAAKFVEENGYVDSFNRRLATIDDIKVDEIKHINNGDGKLKEVSIFDNLKPTKSHQHKKNEFEGVEEVGIEKFMKDILPSCTSVEAYLENSHSGNMVTMTTSNVEGSKPMFKWNNNYSWTFNGNIAGKSQIKDAVKENKGAVDGVLRFSIMWADGDGDNSDLDAHCNEPGGNTIYYGDKYSYKTEGSLDIDITNPNGHRSRNKKDVVENITYPKLEKMIDGVYKFKVHQFSDNNSKGFKAEIEFNGETYNYEYKKPLAYKQFVDVAYVTLKNGKFTIDHKLPETHSSKVIYGLDTKQFHKVNLICLSPNHWGENNVGNKHYFFMLDKCKAETQIRSYHIENFNAELAKHRKVLEPLASTIMLSPEGDQLSGLGFNATVKDSLIVKLSGNFKRTIKIKF